MRLKFLFFPIILVVSLSIFIGYIWPEVNNIQNINAEKLANTQTLQAVKDKQSAIQSIGTQINNDSTGRATVDNYLPDKKVEERIIGGVNYLALDSGVSLSNISLKSLVSANATADGMQPSTVAATSPANSLTTDAVPSDPADEMQFVEASISISGNYEKIRLFVDQLQKISLLNNTKSLIIYNQKKNPNNPVGGENPDPSILLADITMDFGYLPPLKLNTDKIANFKPESDQGTIDVLNQYVLQKTESITSMISDASNKGKANPFLP